LRYGGNACECYKERRQGQHGKTPLGTEFPKHIHGSPGMVTVGVKGPYGTTFQHGPRLGYILGILHEQREFTR
jgi:hypothetical protein